jgi:tetratricopeptide (TPR) repeat protein
MDAILNRDPRPLAAHVPPLDPRIIRIVMKSLEKDPDRRYQDLAQMRRDVERIRLEFALADRSQDPVTATTQPTSLPDLADRRQQQIAANLETADRAFELGDFEAALVACEDVLIIDPHNARAHDGRGRAHAALTERQAFAHLNVARQHFSRGEITLAEGSLQAALAIMPDLGEGLVLRDELGSARQQQEQRIRALNAAIDRARVRFLEGAFESAIDAANEALEYSPADSEARRLKADAVVALDERRRQQEIARRAQAAADEAARLSARDRYGDARRVLDEPLIANHPTVRQARAIVEAAEAEFTQMTAAAEERARIALAETIVVRTEPATGPVPGGDTLIFQAPPTPTAPITLGPIAATLPPPADRAGTPLRLDIAHVAGGYLSGPVRARRAKSIPRPVRFQEAEVNRAGARDWLDGQRFAGVTQGRGSVSFGSSLTTHLIVATAGVMYVLARAVAPPTPPTPALMSMLAAVTPPPQTVDPPPQRTIEKPRPTPTAAPGPRHAQPAITPPAPEVRETTTPPVAPIDHVQTTTDLPTGLAHNDVLAPPGPPTPSGPSGEPGLGDFTPVTDFDQGPVAPPMRALPIAVSSAALSPVGRSVVVWT